MWVKSSPLTGFWRAMNKGTSSDLRNSLKLRASCTWCLINYLKCVIDACCQQMLHLIFQLRWSSWILLVIKNVFVYCHCYFRKKFFFNIALQSYAFTHQPVRLILWDACVNCMIDIESQNHTMVEIGRDLWKSSSPTSPVKQGYPKQVAPVHVWMAFQYIQE